MEHVKKILIVDDERSVREFLEVMLQQDGHQVRCVESGLEAIGLVDKDFFNLVITDIRIKPIDGLQVLRECKRISPETVVIVISAYASTETAVCAMKEGAYDYLPKPFKVDEMRAVISDALQIKKGVESRRKPSKGPLYFDRLIGESPSMLRIYELIERVAGTPSNVLITGESGTGKELVARAIHQQSQRHGRAFMAVNCGGVPEPLIESEMFGYKRGAFTGAAASRKGLVEAARGGTLFLDEVSELSPSLQVKLLRLVQERTVRMVGGTEDIPVDVRIVAATNCNLEMMVIEGKFREDLYHRLNVLPINIPPLRERRQDIPLLADYFLTKYRKAFDKDVHKISSYAMDILSCYDFPGNVRELENIIERGVALETSSIILPESLTLAKFKKRQNHGLPYGAVSLPSQGMDLGKYLANIEKDLLVQSLQKAQGVKVRAAELLGISFRSLRYRLAKYGLAGEDSVTGGARQGCNGSSPERS